MDGSSDPSCRQLIPPTGLTVVVSPDVPSLDIIFVHGFTGHPERTWTHQKGDARHRTDEEERSVERPAKRQKLGPFSKPCQKTHHTAIYWPRDLLPATVPNARVLTYGYDTLIKHKLGPPLNKSTVYDIAWDFLIALEAERRAEPLRPAFFVVHSLGGIIVKEMLRRSSSFHRVHTHLQHIFGSTMGIMFFGTPHGGADPRGILQRIAEEAIKALRFSINEQIVNTFLPSAERLRELRDEFGSMAQEQNWTIHSFQEQFGVTALNGDKIVEDASSYLNLPAIEVSEHIGRNHMDMCRFTGPHDVEYRKVASALRRVTASAPSQPKSEKKLSFMEEQTRMLLDSLRFDQIDARRMTIKNAHAKTCKWLLKNPKYFDWLDATKLGEHHGFLWIKGKPGAGKSTLMKFALSNARETMKDRIVISFFFNARGEDLEKSTLGAYRSLLLQLLEQLPALQCVFNLLGLSTSSISTCHQWSIESLEMLLEQAIQSLGESSVLCFIDALDECEECQIRDMISFFDHVGELTISAGIRFRVCFSSRHYPYITIRKGLDLVLEGQEGHSQDITKYLDSELKIGYSKLAEQVRTEIQERAAGVFMWVILVVGILKQEYNGGRIYTLQRRLRETPGDLHELFRDILTRDSHNKDELVLCVQWVLFARQPLSPEQLYFAILSGVEPEALSRWDSDGTPMDVIEKFILHSSKGLMEVIKSKFPNVQFIHESVKDFLIKENWLANIWPDLGSNFRGQSHERLKQCCLNYMNLAVSADLDFNESHLKDSREEATAARKSTTVAFPFLEYAVRNVLHHADIAEGGGISQANFVQKFPLADWTKIYNLLEKYEVRRHTEKVSLLYILAEGNMSNLIRGHPSILSYLEVENERYGPPLFAALATGSKEVVRAFVEARILDRSPGSWLHGLYNQHYQDNGSQHRFGRDFIFSKRRTVLSYLAELGDEIIFALALEADQVKVDSGDKGGRTPLSWAAEKGHEAVVKLLLATGKAEVDSKDKDGRTPLSWAAEKGHEAVVKLLLATGKAEVDSKDKDGRTPLSWAAEKGHEAVVKLLLETGKADVDLKDNYGWTPLWWAIGNGHEAVVKLLETGKAEVDSKDNYGQTALQWAAEKGHEVVVKLLLETGKVDVDSKDNHGQTALQWAAEKGHEAVVKLLLATGKVDIDSKDDNGRTPLSCAAGNRHEAVVKLLLDKGADVNTQVGEYGNTPQAAPYQEHTAYSTEDYSPRRAPPMAKSSSDIPSIFTGSKKPYSTVPSSSGIRILANVLKPLSNKETSLSQIDPEQLCATDETSPLDDGASTASPSSTNWTPEQRDTIVTEFSEAVRKQLPKNLLNATSGREFDGIFLKDLAAMFKDFSNSIKQDASTKRIRAVSKSIRQFRQDISERCVEKFWGDTGMLASPGLAERADAHGGRQKTSAEKVYDWKFDLAANSLLDDGAHLPRGLQPQTEPVTQRQVSEALLENASEAGAISHVSSDSSETLSLEHKDIQDFLVNHVAFSNLIKNMERLLGRYCDDQMSIIGQRIFRNLQRSSSNHRVSFITDWDPVDFLSSEYELGLQQDLGRVLTITGEPVNAQQVPVLTYLRQTWPSYPLNLLDAIRVSICRITHPEVSSRSHSSGSSTAPAQYSPIGNDISPPANFINVDLEKRNFTVTGSADFVAVVAQQLSWLSAACRVSVKGLACSYLEFECTSSVSPEFHIGIHVEPVKGNKACWNKIVGNSVVARGFPIARRRYCIGLQAPLETLAGLVGISLAMEHEGGHILKGRSHIFVPVKRIEDEVQWHLIDRYPKRIKFDEVDDLDKRLLFKDLDEVALQSTKAFLGWCSNAVNRLGTSNAHYDYNSIVYSGTSRESTPELVFRGLGLGFSKIGVGTANFDYRTRQGVYNTEKSNSYKTTLEDANGLHVILHDTRDKRAWHTNAERLILHMILHRYYRNSFEIDKRPVYIEPADENAGVSVRDAMWKNANTALFRDWKAGKDEETVWRFREMFEELLRTLEKLQYEETTVRTRPKIRLSWDPRGSILGWEYMDLVERKRQLHLKSTKVEATFGKWPYFARDIGAVVLFGSGFHEILEPKEPDQLCCGFQTLPHGRGYLAMDISVLRALHISEGSPGDQARLTPTGFTWQRSTHVFERCNKTSQASQNQVNLCECKRIQELERPRLVNRSRRPGEIDACSGHDDGVVIFGAAGRFVNILGRSQSQPHQDQHLEISRRNPEQSGSNPICVSLEGDAYNEYIHSQAEIRVHNGRDVVRRNQDVSMSPEPSSLQTLQPQLSD
ncbi:hypothetical protein FGG08_006859 [Glutinoglossum americanum]|uniref:Nephrocystin 3-like N-terminal domain-containing protein n=1 Tax=Glutinoglossum americanum TaxID=1670608 RepID=A0A9P8HVF8_9PEZI|nr:hypothetical protein FGG08_006859 [Glutinoglossum americanum]